MLSKFFVFLDDIDFAKCAKTARNGVQWNKSILSTICLFQLHFCLFY